MDANKETSNLLSLPLSNSRIKTRSPVITNIKYGSLFGDESSILSEKADDAEDDAVSIGVRRFSNSSIPNPDANITCNNTINTNNNSNSNNDAEDDAVSIGVR
jgi:hypothetical protein